MWFCILCRMSDAVDIVAIKILNVDQIEGCGISVAFTDGTSAHYPSEELASLRPYRERSQQDFDRASATAI
jgi:hypothetical protein